jgi:leucyl-tRNA synthetase
VQVGGKLRATLEVDADAEQSSVEPLARALPAVEKQLSGANVRKVVFVKNRIINFIV